MQRGSELIIHALPLSPETHLLLLLHTAPLSCCRVMFENKKLKNDKNCFNKKNNALSRSNKRRRALSHGGAGEGSNGGRSRLSAGKSEKKLRNAEQERRRETIKSTDEAKRRTGRGGRRETGVYTGTWGDETQQETYDTTIVSWVSETQSQSQWPHASSCCFHCSGMWRCSDCQRYILCTAM